MSSRTVSVVLTAQVQNYLTNLKAAEAQTLALEKSTKTATQQFAAHNEALTKVGVGMLAVGATAAAGVALVVKAASDFGAKMAQLQSLSHASSATMQQLATAAMSVGTAYGFSATQVADAQIELVKAGVSVKAQLGGALVGALTLAAAGQMDVAGATEITTVAMTQFQLSAKDVPHLADLLAAGADKALGSVADLGEGLKNGGLQAHNMGLSIDDTVGLLSAFANAGILGAEAGTQMRSMFLRLQNPTSAAQKTLDQYGISINDASGKFVGITKFADELHDKLDGLSQAQRNSALATVFGSHAIVGATVLYQDGGAAAEKAGKGIGDWIANVNDSGFAAAQAAGKMNSLQGDTQKLAAVFQTDLIKAGSGANTALRGLVQTGTNILSTFGAIPAPIQNVAVEGTALVAVVGLAGGAFLVAVPKVVAFRTAVSDLGLTMKGTLATAGGAAAALVGITMLMSGMSAASQQGAANTKQVSDAADSMRKKFADVNSLFAGNALVGSGIKNAFDQEGNGEAANNKGLDGLLLGITHVGDVYKSHEGAFAALGSQLTGLSKINYTASTQGFATLVTKVGAAGDATKQMNLVKLLGPDYQSQLSSIAKGIGVTASQTNLLAIAGGKGAIGQKALAYATAQAQATAAKQASTLASLAGQASSATTSIDSLQKTIEGFGSAQLDARSATRAMYQAIDDATAAVKKNKAGLDVQTQAGRDNQAALDGIATAADNAASKTLKQTGSVEKAQAVMKTGRDAFIKAAGAMGLSGTQAARLADKLGLIPKNITTAVQTTGFDGAMSSADALSKKMNNLTNGAWTVDVRFAAAGSVNDVLPKGGKVTYGGMADGGAVDGPGPKGKDSVLAWLAPGEHVLTAKDVDRMGGQARVYSMRAGLNGYADGGAVSSSGGSVLDRNRAEVQAAIAAAAKKTIAAGSKSAITEAADAITAASREKATETARLAAAKKQLTADNKAATVAEKAYTKASDAAANISGKGTAAEKHAAEMRARDLKKDADAAKATAADQSKTVDAISKKLDTATQTITDQTDRKKALNNDREDFVSTQSRATADNPIDPMSYVDQLRTMSRDDNYSVANRHKFDDAANAAEKSLTNLQDASTKAATTLTDLQNASTQMHDSITSSIAGGYTLSGAQTAAGAATSTTGWEVRNGVRFQTSTSGGAATASSIAGYYQSGAGSSQQFADALKQLAGRGLNSALLAELAGMGTEQGLPIAQAILSGSAADLQSINSGYGSIQSIASVAGSTVADANYAAQIAAADANAQQITDEIATQGDALRKIIATAFGLKGYAVGTRNATPGLHWVGEQGPELAGFTGGESVLTAGASKQWVRGGSGSGGTPQITVQAAAAQFPDTITVADATGFEMKMRVIATQQIAKDAAQDAVLMMGKAV